MTQREAIEICRRQDSVKLNVAVAALGISRKTADKRRKIDGCIADGVRVIPVTERCFLVASAAILRRLELQGSPPGFTHLTRGGNGERRVPASDPPLVSVPGTPIPAKEGVRVESTRSPEG